MLGGCSGPRHRKTGKRMIKQAEPSMMTAPAAAATLRNRHPIGSSSAEGIASCLRRIIVVLGGNFYLPFGPGRAIAEMEPRGSVSSSEPAEEAVRPDPLATAPPLRQQEHLRRTPDSSCGSTLRFNRLRNDDDAVHSSGTHLYLIGANACSRATRGFSF